MKAITYSDWGKLTFQDIERPKISEDDVLIEVSRVGICGSELHQFSARDPRRTPPLILGHEFSGVVVDLGSEVERISLGQRVTANPMVTCGDCIECRGGRSNLCRNLSLLSMHRPGAFAEYVAVPERCVHPIPEGLSLRMAAMAEPLATAVHGLRLVARTYLGNVAIIGAGTIGLMALQTARVLGALRVMVVEVIPKRLEVAKALGADLVINPTEGNPLREGDLFTREEGVDVVIEAVGLDETRQESVSLCRRGGVAVWLGLHAKENKIMGRDVVVREKCVQGSFCYTDGDFRMAISLLAKGDINVDWVDEVPLSEGADIFLRLADDPGDLVKVLLLP